MAKEITLVLAANSTSEYGDGPGWASIVLTDSFVSRLESVLKLVQENDLTGADIDYAPDKWENQEEYRLLYDEACISRIGFYFRSWPKHANYAVETNGIEISSLRELLEKGESEDVEVINGVAYYPASEADNLSHSFAEEDDAIDLDEEVETA